MDGVCGYKWGVRSVRAREMGVGSRDIFETGRALMSTRRSGASIDARGGRYVAGCTVKFPRSYSTRKLAPSSPRSIGSGMFRILATCLLGVLIANVHAIHSSEAGVVDWYKPLIGDALTGNPSLSPVFHRVGEANEPTKSYVLTATTANVLAALHPENGTIGA